MKVPLFVELCAGLASVSGVLEHGSTWKPPVSRMGRKTGYASAILRVMGLRPRQRAERYLWAEADGDVAALLAAYTQPEKMREIAAIIRSWIPCPYGPHEVDPSCSRCKGTGRWDARDLWEVLRREERRGLWEGGATAEEVTVNAWTDARSYGRRGASQGFTPGIEDDPKGGASTHAIAARFERCSLPWPPVLIAQDAAVDVGSVAGWMVEHARSDTIGKFAEEEDDRPRGGWRGNGPGREDLAERCGCIVWPPVLIAQDAAVNVASVAGWAMGQAWAAHGKDHNSYGGPGRIDGSETEREGVARRFSCPVWPPVYLTPSADLPVPPLPPGTVVYMDPPYAGTTGYKASFSRDQVCETAERWATAGAHVYISEAEPIAALGWHHVEITSERKGQARTFGATPEWLTCSHRPAWTPPQQSALFCRPT